MENIYSLLDMLLPFEWLEYNFMKNAFLAVLLITPLFGVLSTMVVSNRMAFFSDSLGHAAFTGIAIGALAGIMSPMVSLIVFSVIFALLITYIKNTSSASADTVIGVFSSVGIALGLMLVIVILIIAGFTYYTSVAQDLPFKSRFLEMATISISVAVLSFVVGKIAKIFLGVDL